MPFHIHRFVQDARDDDGLAFNPIIDAVLACGNRPDIRTKIAGGAELRMIQQPLHDGANAYGIVRSGFGAMRGETVIEYVVEIADRRRAKDQLQARPCRLRPRAMMSSIVASVSGDASPSSIAARNARNRSSRSWSRRTRSRT